MVLTAVWAQPPRVLERFAARRVRFERLSLPLGSNFLITAPPEHSLSPLIRIPGTVTVSNPAGKNTLESFSLWSRGYAEASPPGQACVWASPLGWVCVSGCEKSTRQVLPRHMSDPGSPPNTPRAKTLLSSAASD
ncbi:hypothetical protein EYF80_026300 [Liparis tanakae]|uniref:Uncharacterized protein n=1 Tax=Liparis tanakae TaxID=230148 RepID=A0A4Z2HD64_9TELE|nr:hypothetical protein EYF80_026300 [Liparis tanakae]